MPQKYVPAAHPTVACSAADAEAASASAMANERMVVNGRWKSSCEASMREEMAKDEHGEPRGHSRRRGRAAHKARGRTDEKVIFHTLFAARFEAVWR